MKAMTLESARYGLIQSVMQIDNIDILARAQRSLDRLVKKAQQMTFAPVEEVEYITKEEQLAMIRQGLLEVKEAREKGVELTDAFDFLNEL